jgi:bifunctional DNA-binding transcriptional regulator/antitoxin component of YhaV-PrlF toxin-antitoxin module
LSPHDDAKEKDIIGIVRIINDLGRVFIPQKIHQTMCIREGDPLLTTLTPIDRFCWAIHSVAERIKAR